MSGTSARKRLCAAAAVTAAVALIGGLAVGGATAAGATTNNLVTLRPGDFDFTGTEHGGHNVFQASGIQISTDNADNAEATGEFAVNKPLADVGEPSLQWTQTDPDGTIPPATLLSVDFDGDGTFDGYLIGETAYDGDWWAPSSTADFVKEGAPSCTGWMPGDDPSTKCTGGGGSYFHGTLDEWRAAFPDAQVQLAGYNLGSGVENAGLLSSVTVGNTAYNFTKILDQTQTIQEGDFVPSLADTRSSGHFVFNKNSLHVNTDDNSSQAKVAEYWQPTNPIPLVHAGQPALDWTGTDNQPGIQLVVDFDNNGTPDGILVGEKVYGDDWWASGSTAQFVKDAAPSCTDIDTGDPNPGGCTGGSGSPYHGLLAEWATAFPDAKILYVGFSLGSGVLGDGVMNSIDVSNTEYTFANTPPTANDQTVSTAFGQPVDITLDATDPNSADTLQYTVGTPSHGQISGTAPSITYTPDAGFAGQDSFTWTVSDGVNDPVTGTVTVNVGKATSSLGVAFQPAPATSADNVHAVVTVDTAGDADGGTVSVDVGKRGGHLYTGTVSGGQADVTLGKYDGGLHNARITFTGTDNTKSSHTSTTFRVHKVSSNLSVTTDPTHIKTTTKNGELLVSVSTPGVSPNGASVSVKHLGSAVVKHGVATIDLPKLSAGTNSYTAKYSGNGQSTAASTDFVIHVTKG